MAMRFAHIGSVTLLRACCFAAQERVRKYRPPFCELLSSKCLRNCCHCFKQDQPPELYSALGPTRHVVTSTGATLKVPVRFGAEFARM